MVQEACVGKQGNKMCNPLPDLWQRRKNLTGVNLRGLTITAFPYSTFDNGSGGYAAAHGIFPDILEELRDILNFTLTIQVPGSFTDLVQTLRERRADVGIVDLSITHSRSQIIDFTVQVDAQSFKLFVKSSGKYTPNMLAPLFVFRPEAWIVLGVVWAVLLAAKIAELHFEMTSNGSCTWDSVQDGTSLVLNAIILQGHYRASEWLPGKFLIITISLFGIFCFACYDGGFLSKLAVKHPEFKINSMEEVLYSDVDIGTTTESTPEAFFKLAAEDSLPKRIWLDKMLPNYDRVMAVSAREGLQRVEEEDDYAFFAPTLMGQVKAGYPCQFQEVGTVVLREPLGFGLQKDSPLRGVFDSTLR